MNQSNRKLNLDKLGVLRTLRATNGPNFVEDLLEVYAKTTQEGLVHLREATQTGDQAAVMELAHYLKASSACVGAHYMAALCLEIETLAKSGDAQNRGSQMIEILEKEFKNAIIELRQSSHG